MKKLSALLLSATLLFSVMFSFTSCTFPWEEERDRVFEEIDKLERHSDYAIITDREYVTASEKIVFEDLVKNKISKDGHKIKTEKFGTFQRFSDFIVFSLNYKSGKRFWGINDSNNHWAVGIISLDDFSIEIHYLKNKYERVSPSFPSNTHLSFDMLDKDKDSTKNKDTYSDKDYERMVIERSNGEITILEGLGFSAAEMIGEPFESYKTPNSFVWNGKTFTITNHTKYSSIWNENGEQVAELNGSVKPLCASFEYSDILQVSTELQQINTILGEGSENEIAARFFTNGEDLFVGFVTDMSMFGVMCNLTCPVIFKTDLNFESFEYIGCVSQSFMTDFDSTVQINKIN
ncbi:MAG: hypothetical protein IKC48_04295 [Clostridia bacterium]|nr:hypothetical protein [Clostridia bacterium]